MIYSETMKKNSIKISCNKENKHIRIKLWFPITYGIN